MCETYFTVTELAKYTGVSRQAVYGWIRRGLPVVSIEKDGPTERKVMLSDYRSWLEENIMTNVNVEFIS